MAVNNIVADWKIVYNQIRLDELQKHPHHLPASLTLFFVDILGFEALNTPNSIAHYIKERLCVSRLRSGPGKII